MSLTFTSLLLPLVAIPQDPGQIASTATNGLAVDVYRQVAARMPGSNLFLSPWSICQALTMAAEGARGATAAEMRRTLHLPDGAMADVHAAFAAVQERLVTGAGSVPKATRDRLAELRGRLAKLNDEVTAAANRAHYAEASAKGRAADQVATELNGLLATVDCYDLRAANSLWCDRQAPLLPDFLAALDRHYGTGSANPVDFCGDSETARRQINDWVAQRTERRIVDLIPAGGVDAATQLVLANAVYFRGEWQDPFAASGTTAADFTMVNGQRLAVRLMRDASRADVPYAAFAGNGEFFATPTQIPADGSVLTPTYPDAAGFQVIELPYKGGDLAMVVLLPRAHDGLPRLEQLLTADNLAQWLSRLERRNVDTALPRFQQRCELQLADTLQALGMQRAFVDPTTRAGAEFEGINGATELDKKVFISQVFHQAFVEVTEKGTEAAAATAVEVGPTSAVPRRVDMIPFRPVFRAERPFLFLIRDTKSGTILFVGSVHKPEAKA